MRGYQLSKRTTDAIAKERRNARYKYERKRTSVREAPLAPIEQVLAKHFLTPSGGIPARTGTSSPWTPGVAECTMCEYYLDGSTVKIRTTAVEANVYNSSKHSIGGSKLIQAKKIDGRWTVDVDECDA